MTVWEADFFGCEARVCGRHDPSFDARDQADQAAVCAIAGRISTPAAPPLCPASRSSSRRLLICCWGPWHMWQRLADNNPANAAQHTKPILSVGLHNIPGLPRGESYIFNVKIGGF
jgi:hypothetical protein